MLSVYSDSNITIVMDVISYETSCRELLPTLRETKEMTAELVEKLDKMVEACKCSMPK